MSMQIVPFVPDRFPDAARIMSIALKRKVSLARFRRKYLVGGDADQGYGFLMLDKGEAIGVAGSVPYRYVTPEGDVVVGAQYSDFGLLPAYRGTGLYNELCLHLHANTRERGAAFSFALTSEGSRAAMERALDHTTFGDLCNFDIPLSSQTGFFARLVDRAKRSIMPGGGSCNVAPAPRRGPGHAHAERGPDFVKIKRANGVRFWNCNGHPVMIKHGGVANVAIPEDMDPAEVPALLDTLGQRARRVGTRTLRFMLSSHDPAFAVLQQIAGPSPGQLKPCMYIWDKRLSVEKLSFGFADYESF